MSTHTNIHIYVDIPNTHTRVCCESVNKNTCVDKTRKKQVGAKKKKKRDINRSNIPNTSAYNKNTSTKVHRR